MSTVAITGIGGLIGRRLVAELANSTEVERIVGIDARRPEGLHGDRIHLVVADVRDGDLHRHLEGVDTLVHLAFQLDPLRDEVEMRSINVDGTRNLFAAGLAAGVRKIVYVSSGVVYGAHPDNDFPLTEDSPLRANPDFPYAEHKLEIERWLADWSADRETPIVTVLRPTVVAGPGVENFISRQFEAPRATAIRGHRPPMQFVHVDDVASALALTIERDLPGAYNVAPEGWLSFDEMLAVSGARTVEVPEEVAFSLAQRLGAVGLSEVPVGQLHYVMHPWILSPDRLIQAGWRPKRSNRDALVELAEEHQGYVSVGRVRARRRDVKLAAVGFVALGGLLLLRALRRDRS
jgi:nucleoside-diphosphate-sugar epimerase